MKYKHEFEYKIREWDRYQHFYVEYRNGFTRFETGELMYRHNDPVPDQRMDYDEYEVTIAATSDKHCPTLYTPEGDVIPKAHLGFKGIQYLVIDNGKAYALNRAPYYRDSHDAPSYLYEATAYWFGENSQVRGTQPINVYRPDKELVKSLKSKVSDVIAACVAAERIAPSEGYSYYWDVQQADRRWVDMDTTQIVAELTRNKKVRSVADRGIEFDRLATTYDYLLTEKR